MTEESVYSDLNQRDPFEVGQEILTNTASVFQSIQNILTTRKGERLFNPEFGIDLEDHLFELMDDISEIEIEREVTEAIRLFEPRVAILHQFTKITPDPTNNQFNLKLVFRILGFEDTTYEISGTLTQ